jgi:ABC-2 type transport system permease protein
MALVGLRLRLELRSLRAARGQALGLAVAIPGIAFFSLVTALLAFVGVRTLASRAPDLLLPALSGVATLVALLWLLSPLLAGIAMAETHDLTRLVHFPVPLRTLVASSLLSNLFQPTVLAQALPVVAVSAALSQTPLAFPLCLAGVLLSFLLLLAGAQTVGLAVLGITRHRRWSDLALFVGLGLGFLLSMIPMLLLLGGGLRLRGPLAFVLDHDVFALSPFAWGVRAAVLFGQGELQPAALFGFGALVALFGTMLLTASLAGRVYRGELVFGSGRTLGATARARMLLPGTEGALVEKDLRIAWRDPRLKATLFTGLFGPLILLLFVWRGPGAGVSPGLLLFFATVTGIGTFGSNAFALERRGLALLLGFPVDRARILLAKNLVALILRLPGLVVLLIITLTIAGPGIVLPVATIAVETMLLAAGADNFMSILFPIPVPPPGRDPFGPASGGRGLGAAALTALLLAGAFLSSLPFTFLVWLPYLLEAKVLWLVTLPLALGGAVAAYGMMVAAAGRLLARREPQLIARVLSEE